MAVKRWVIVVAGIVIFVVIVGVGLIATAVYFAAQHVQVTTSKEMPADFEQLRARFANQRPFIELNPDDPHRPIVHHETEQKTRTPLTTLHLIAWDPREKQVFKLDLPFWLLRFSRSGTIRISDHGGSGFVFEGDNAVTAADIERHGPGLILDQDQTRGERVLIWVE